MQNRGDCAEQIFNLQVFLAWLFLEKTLGIAIAFASLLLAGDC